MVYQVPFVQQNGFCLMLHPAEVLFVMKFKVSQYESTLQILKYDHQPQRLKTRS